MKYISSIIILFSVLLCTKVLAGVETPKDGSGYKNLTWGMKYDDVKNLYPSIGDIDEKGEARINLDDIQCTYIFRENMLEGVKLDFNRFLDMKEQSISYIELKERMVSYYGRATDGIKSTGHDEYLIWKLSKGYIIYNYSYFMTPKNKGEMFTTDYELISSTLKVLHCSDKYYNEWSKEFKNKNSNIEKLIDEKNISGNENVSLFSKETHDDNIKVTVNVSYSDESNPQPATKKKNIFAIPGDKKEIALKRMPKDAKIIQNDLNSFSYTLSLDNDSSLTQTYVLNNDVVQKAIMSFVLATPQKAQEMAKGFMEGHKGNSYKKIKENTWVRDDGTYHVTIVVQGTIFNMSITSAQGQ